MIPVNDIEYLMVREMEERLACRKAIGEPARLAHAKMADLYGDQVWTARTSVGDEALSSADPRPTNV